MLYNKWVIDILHGKIDISLNQADMEDRVERDVFLPTIMPGRSYIYFPRIDESTNKKYKTLLLLENISALRKEIEELSKLEEELKKHLV